MWMTEASKERQKMFRKMIVGIDIDMMFDKMAHTKWVGTQSGHEERLDK